MEQSPNYEKAREKASKLLEKYDIVRPPVDPEPIARAEGIDVFYVDFKGDSQSKVSGVYDFEKKRIYVNKSISVNRMMFTIAHELAHVLLHEDYTQSDEYRALPQENIYFEKNNKEKEADAFAVSLLVPRDFLKKYAQFATISKLADIFLVSEDIIINQKNIYNYVKW